MNGTRRAVVTMLATLVLTTPLLVTAPVVAGSAGLTAAPAWSPVTRLAPNAQSQALTVDGRGTFTAVWATGSWPQQVVAARRRAGGSWSAPRVLGRGYAPVAEADTRGRVTVVWLSRRPDFTDAVMAVRRPVGGPWSAPVRLTRDKSVPGYPVDGEEAYGAAQVDLAVSGRGAAVVTWTWGSDERTVPWRIQAAVRPASGSWSAPRDVTSPGPLRHPDVDIAGDGTATLVYGRQPLGRPQAVLARRRVPGAGWTKPVRVAAEGYAHVVAVDRAGDAVVAYSPDFSRVKARYRPASGGWQPARALSPAGAEISDFALAMNGPGWTVVAMGRSGGRVDLTTRMPGTSWGAPELVAGPGEPLAEVAVALNDRGDLYVGWGCYALFGKHRPAGDAWSNRFTVSPDAGVEVLEAADAVAAPDGDVAVLWDQESMPLKVRVLSAS